MNKTSNLLYKFITLLFLLLLISGCGGGGGNNDSDPSNIVSDDTDTNNDPDDEATDNPAGDYDLVAYLFDASLERVGARVSYQAHMNNQQTGEEVMAQFELSEQWEKTDENTIAFSVNDSQEPEITYVIHDSSIEDIKHNSENMTLSMIRFVSIGDTYEDEHVTTPISDDSHISCQVLDHLDSFDLKTLTSGMADGIYQDVLHVHCLMSVSDAPLNDMETFYAKGIGHVLSIDNLGLLIGGPSVFIPQRDGTIYYGSGS